MYQDINLKNKGMKLTMTINQRITLADMLPARGSLDLMDNMSSIKKSLIGFNGSELESWRIVEVNGKLHSGKPDQGTSVTLSDTQVIALAELIGTWSERGKIPQDFAELFTKIVNEAESILSSTEPQPEETENE